ncbi:MAG TPA: RNA methyltransferase [Leucothrix sp.]|nr:RNA methyltransferase [Leucothrix sp.]
MLKNIRVVLVRTYHPGNIGSAARAMKTMGLTNLVLVNPLDFPSDEATKMAASADDVLKSAILCNSVYDAVKDCTVVIASTARSRDYDLPELTPEESAEQLFLSAKKNKVALVFGPERMGLSNDDLQFAKYRVTIPANPEYSSLNLAAAVQTLSYEIFKQHTIKIDNKQAESQRELPSTEQMEQYFTRLEETLKDSGFIIQNHPGKVMQKLRSLFARAQLDDIELNILHGILASYQRQNKKAK